MALPTLDATFVSSADLPRKQMLAKWLVEELGETQAPSSVAVSGLEPYLEFDPNGKYSYVGELNGKPRYEKNVDQFIEWSGTRWDIRAGGDLLFFSEEDVAHPWLTTFWFHSDGSGSPVFTESPAPSPISNYYSLPERYLWAKIAVAAGAPKTEADYISLPKNYAWSDIYNAVAGDSGPHIDWTEKQALGHIAAAYRGDTGNAANLATYINWPWRYKVAAIISHLVTPESYNAVIVSGAGTSQVNGTYTERGISLGKPYYNLIGELNSIDQSSVFWAGTDWTISDSITDTMYISGSSVNFPWQATGWTAIVGSNPVPTLTPTNV